MNYDHFQRKDFLHNDSFVRWVLFQENDPFWQEFLKQHPAKTNEVTQAKQLILTVKKAEGQNMPVLNQKAVWANIEDIISEVKEAEEQTGAVQRFWHSMAFRWAASLLFLAGAAWFWTVRKPDHQVSYQDLITAAEEKSPRQEVANNDPITKTIHLEDGTTVHLEKGGRLSFPVHFETKRREVVLSGEAFFEVAENPAKPFYVYANELITRVLGTSFRISALENGKQVTVKVQTGRVSVFKQNRVDIADPETKGLLLLPNQQAVFNRTNEALNRSLVEVPVPIIAQSPRVKRQFEEVKVSEVFKELEKLFGVEIRYNEDALSDCILTTTISDDSLYDQLEVICQTIGAGYKEIDAQIIIESKGCK
ncbi:FecR family protein [Runella slithyformis]|uniref:Anti-FecI sigma factor, FecR n=1 Tax=Runella slithyformis (strain ATCC 29530 / DSM 19594 / LMG 11500 / NCIMB 11436 / LSU 4) TaxID=761193 RepID=A0A7U3ZPZ9_RUNSL|nr:FecR family protein [Runella slithyformis]AEI51244.1 anti-FecI sigma factor, FecR [Runella slithyformis DSM 19594]